MSGVLIKMGIYGLLRVTSLARRILRSTGAWFSWGWAWSREFLGVAFAIGQHDLKRLLAYHSIENIGIIVMGLGLAMIGRSLGRADWVVLGLGGGLLHVWNHALFKSLLFFSAARSSTPSTPAKSTTWAAGQGDAVDLLCFLVGSVAICGLPPLNGFVSEFLIYLGLFGHFVPGAGAVLLPARPSPHRPWP